jgi:peptidoglycan/LPS O-acetylase OafA/YrhL
MIEKRVSSSPSIPDPVARIDYVDGLRALAVLTVLASHIALHAPNLRGPLYHAVMEGAHGVDLFFILSGFCLAYPTLRKFRQRGATGFLLSDFAAKRLVRIVPPFYLATLFLVIVGIAANVAGHPTMLAIPPVLDLVKTVFFLDEHVQLLNGSFWTLMVEFRWYFAFPLLLALWLKSPRGFCAVGVSSAVLYTFTRARGLDLGTLPGFMLGIIAADVYVGARLRDSVAATIKRLAPLLVLPCAALGIAVESSAWIPGFDGADVEWAYQPTIAGWQFAMFFFVVAAGTSAWTRKLLSSAPLIATGIASYSIYLVHEPIVDILVHKFAGPAGFAVAAAVALAVGFAFWFVAERPFTTGSLRRPLLDATLPVVRRCFAFLGIPERIPLPATGIPANEAA